MDFPPSALGRGAEGYSKTLLLFLGILLCYVVFQFTPLGFSWLSIVNPVRALWLSKTQEVLAVPGWSATITYSPLNTAFAFLWSLFLVVFGFQLRKTFQADDSPKWLMRLLFLFVGFEALFGLLQVLMPPLSVLRPGLVRGYARGTFINQNHFACFLGMMWPVLLMYAISSGERSHRPRPALSALEKDRQRESAFRQIFFMMVIGLVILALVFSRSRAGILSSLVALSVLIFLGGLRRGGVISFAAISWMIMIGYGSLIGFDKVLARFDMIYESGPGGRLRIWADTLQLIQDHLFTGVGLGSYPMVIRLYQTSLTDILEIGHAHSDYLELVAELGLPVAAAMILAVFAYWFKTAHF